MRKNLLAFILVFAFVFPSSLAAQTAAKKGSVAMKASENITAKQMQDYLYFIASDEMEGRDTPSRGLDTTAKFIGMNLSRWGFKPAGDNGTYYQKIALNRNAIDPAATIIDIGGQKFSYGDDLVRIAGNANSTISAPIVYAGNGWMIKSKNINPYQNLDVRGKVVAVYSEGPISGRNLVPLPAGITPADLTGTAGTDWADPMSYARANGAVAVIVLPSKFLTENWEGIKQSFGRNRVTVEKFAPAATASPAANAMNVLIASPQLANAMFNGESANPLSGTATPFDLSAGKKFNFTSAVKTEKLMTQNVVAIWEGSDPVLKNEMVAVGAHYDHVGIGGCGRNNGADNICNGADDDGSGTTGVLAMAEALAKSPKRPKRSILFVWHCGEEKGLWGSQYFTEFPPQGIDLKNVIAQLNIDMIGRSKKATDTDPKDKDLSGENAIYVIGSNMMSSQLGKVVADTNNSYLKLNYDLRYDDPKDPNRFFFRSDHFHYAQKGIPIAFWFDGVHTDYHQAGDSPDKIDYNKMEKVSRTIFLTMWELADMKDRPKIDKQLPPELTGGR